MSFSLLKEHLSSYIEIDQHWDVIKNSFHLINLEKGRFFVRQNSICDKIAFINKGCLRYFYFENDKEVTGSFFVESEFVSAFPSFINQERSKQIIDTLEDSELLVISRKDLYQLYEEVPIFEKVGRLIVEKLLITAQNRINEYLIYNPEERYRKFAENFPQLVQRIPQHYIASYIGVTPVSLSRIRKRK